MKRSPSLAISIALCATSTTLHAATKYIDLGGPATGYLAIQNVKNGGSQNDIEGKYNSGPNIGQPNPSHNGLPDYPNFRIPAGHTNANSYSAVIVSPQSTSANYAADFGNAFYGGASLTVNNQTITESNYSTMSAGVISFDDSGLTGVGMETIPVSALTFNFDTYQWDGNTANGWQVDTADSSSISPFSPIHTDYNDGGGAGNAGAIYNLSLSNIGGAGLTFIDGQFVSMDINADLNVLMRYAQFYQPLDSPMLEAGSAVFTGSFSATGTSYEFDLADTQPLAELMPGFYLFSEIHMLMNREGTASVIPEPSGAAITGLALLGLLLRRQRRSSN